MAAAQRPMDLRSGWAEDFARLQLRDGPPNKWAADFDQQQVRILLFSAGSQTWSECIDLLELNSSCKQSQPLMPHQQLVGWQHGLLRSESRASTVGSNLLAAEGPAT